MSQTIGQQIDHYYLIDKDGNLCGIVPSDARDMYKKSAERLRTGKTKHMLVEGTVCVRALGVITGGKK